jgi:hypothetical protein
MNESSLNRVAKAIRKPAHQAGDLVEDEGNPA